MKETKRPELSRENPGYVAFSPTFNVDPPWPPDLRTHGAKIAGFIGSAAALIIILAVALCLLTYGLVENV